MEFRQCRHGENNGEYVCGDLEGGVETPDHYLRHAVAVDRLIPEPADRGAEENGAEQHPESGDDDVDHMDNQDSLVGLRFEGAEVENGHGDLGEVHGQVVHRDRDP